MLNFKCEKFLTFARMVVKNFMEKVKQIASQKVDRL